ncbi:MAG: fused MFS/spermidine synthase [Chloroflexota bacterium]|nr:fused MFS/spermidine synthase [Chloroflexota bacterium]
MNALVFVGGVTSVGIELAASRLIAPYFGDSTFIWANLIGVTLAFLSLGYWAGGRLADRYPRPALLFLLTTVAAVAAALIPWLSRPILSASLDAFDSVAVGAFYGSLVGVLLLIAVPVTLLGVVSPFAIRLRTLDARAAGHAAGNTYALSTVGSILGSFLPVVVLVPWVGTRRTFLILATLLLVPSLAGLLLTRDRAITAGAVVVTVATLAFAWSGTDAAIRPAERGELLHEEESRYNYIQVVEEDGVRYLVLNDGHAVHSIYDPDALLTGGPWDYFMVGPLLAAHDDAPEPESALMIGLAGGTAARQLIAAYPAIEVVGVELDPRVIAVGRDYFALDQPNIEVVAADGRYYLQTTDRTFDVIGVDAYRQPYIPFHLTTVEFFEEAVDHLSPDGVVVVNVGRTETDYRLVEALGTTMAAVFPHVVAIDVERYNNTILVGSLVPLSAGALGTNAARLVADSPARTVADAALGSGSVRDFRPPGEAFTDDHAPVERVVDQIIVDAARERGDE